MRRHLLVATVGLALVATGCGGGDDSETVPQEAASFGAEDITFGESLAQIRGHHRVSLELLQLGDKEGAAVHAHHPHAEILPSLSSELEEHGSDTAGPLTEALDESVSLIESGSPDEVAAVYEKSAGLTEQAQEDVIGGGESVSFEASVIASLLGTVGHEYEEAVGDGKIALLAEYQDAYGFLNEAREMYTAVEPQIEDAEEAKEIEEAFETLEAALPAPEPSGPVADVEEIEKAAALIGHELEETVGAVVKEDRSADEVAENIETLLGEVVETYESGDADAAAELAAEAYLENYEVIEADVIASAPEINEELEPLLGAELRRQIQEGAPVEDVQAMVTEARSLLADALESLES